MEMTTIKTAAVFMIIFGCFAILYPKIFHPMIMQVFGVGGKDTTTEDLINSRTSPHLKKAGKSTGIPAGDDIARHMRAGPHPGMRAAAEMKKQAATQGTGAGKGMMSIVLPMYAVGIVVYLLYTMTKVFGGKQTGEKNDFLSSHFSDVKYDPDRQKFTSTLHGDEGNQPEEEVLSKRFKKGRLDLERLLLKADKNNISTNEMHELKRRLLETESQMTRILSAMETVQKQTEEVVKDAGREEGDGEEGAEGDWVDDEDGENTEEIEAEPRPTEPSPSLSPDMDSYEFINKRLSSTSGSLPRSPSIEELCAQISAHMQMEQDDEAEEEENCDIEEEYSPEAAEEAEEAADDSEYVQSEQAERPEHDDEDVEEDIGEGTEEVLMEKSVTETSDDEHPDLRKRLPRDIVKDSVDDD